MKKLAIFCAFFYQYMFFDDFLNYILIKIRVEKNLQFNDRVEKASRDELISLENILNEKKIEE